MTSSPPKLPSTSGSFTDIERNRDSLIPVPAALPDASCLHRNVTTGQAQGFSSERGHPVFPIRLPSRAVSLSVGDLDPGARTSNHRHAYESMIYVIEGSGYTVIEGQTFEWRAGDAVYVPPWCWHQHIAGDAMKARYLTATNMPVLVALGQTVMREEQRG
jgi:quercetin dioxygenase-like cupin family protein